MVLEIIVFADERWPGGVRHSDRPLVAACFAPCHHRRPDLGIRPRPRYPFPAKLLVPTQETKQ